MNDQNKPVVAEQKDQDSKKPYVSPQLTKHGAIETLTLQSAPNTSQPI